MISVGENLPVKKDIFGESSKRDNKKQFKKLSPIEIWVKIHSVILSSR